MLFFKDYCSPLFLFSLIGVGIGDIGNSKPFNFWFYCPRVYCQTLLYGIEVVLANVRMMLLLKSNTHIPQEILALICAIFFKDYCSPWFLFSLIGVLSEIGNSKPFNLWFYCPRVYWQTPLYGMKVVLANIWMMLLHKSDTHIPQEILALICAIFKRLLFTFIFVQFDWCFEWNWQ